MAAVEVFVMTREWGIFIVLFAALIGLLLWWRRQESKHMKKRVYEAMSPELRREIDEERRTNQEKQRKFQEAMKKAGGGDFI